MAKRRRLTAAERKIVYDKFGGHCAYCGCEITLKEMQADHIEAFMRGGADTVENMYPSCRSCNHYKDTMTIEHFHAALERMPSVLLRDSVTYRIANRFELIAQKKRAVKFYFERVAGNE